MVVVDVCCWVGESFFSGVHDSGGGAPAIDPLPTVPAEVSPEAEMSDESMAVAAGTDLGLMRIT